MPNSENSPSSAEQSSPDYGQIAKFLFEPLVEKPESLKVDCEKLSSSNKVWIRVAFDQEDKGKVFGRSGRNLKAIQTVLNISATAIEQEVHLDVYGTSRDEPSGSKGGRGGKFSRGGRGGGRGRSERPRTRKPSPQLKTNNS